MSPDFRCHVVAKFMHGRAHDRSMVHVTSYFTSNPNTQDDVTLSKYFLEDTEQFHDVHALETAEVLAC
jgi:hypothetical protein